MSALVEAKARALLVSGHVRVRQVTEDQVVVEVDGHTGRYRATWTPSVGWRCTCPERRRRCSHLAAARRITCATDVAAMPAESPP